MKKSILLLALGAILVAGTVKAQNVGVAADKQKQENLEKVKKRQAELKKKYNSMTPEQAAEAKKKADAYKKSGGKKGATGMEPASTPAQKMPSGGAVKNNPVNKGVQVHQSKPHSNKPVWMDPNGKPLPAKPAVQPANKPAAESRTTAPVVAPKTKVVPATGTSKTSETKKK